MNAPGKLEDLSWVERAAVLRVWPDRIWVRIRERKPVAFVRSQEASGPRAQPRLIDRYGVFLDPPAGAEFSLPVVTGISEYMSLPNRLQRIVLSSPWWPISTARSRDTAPLFPRRT